MSGRRPRVRRVACASAAALALAASPLAASAGRTAAVPAAARAVSSAQRAAQRAAQPGVAVAYFAGSSRSRGDDAHVAEALTKGVVRRLAEARGQGGVPLRAVVARPGRDVSQRFVVTGNLVRDDQFVRTTVHLTSARDGAVLWQAELSRPLVQLELLADDIARRLAGQMRVTLPAARPRTLQASTPQAADEYLRGRFYAARYDAASLANAVQAYGAALQLDSALTPARVELALAAARLRVWDDAASASVISLGRSAAERATDLEPRAAAAWAARAMLAPDRTAAERRQALAWARQSAVLDRRSALGEYAAAVVQLRARDAAAAEASLGRALARDPRHAEGLVLAAELRRRAGRPREALALLDRATAADPDVSPAYAVRALVRARLGEVRPAFDDAEIATRLGRPIWGEAARAVVHAAARDTMTARQTARQLAARLPAKGPLGSWDARFVAAALTAGGDPAAAARIAARAQSEVALAAPAPVRRAPARAAVAEGWFARFLRWLRPNG